MNPESKLKESLDIFREHSEKCKEKHYQEIQGYQDLNLHGVLHFVNKQPYEEDYQHFHSWIEDKGKIYDYGELPYKPAFKQYNKKLRKKLRSDGEVVYKEWSKENQEGALKKKGENGEQSDVIQYYINNYGLTGGMREILEEFLKEKSMGLCLIKSKIHKLLHPESVIKIGSVGIKRTDKDKVYWIYGIKMD